MKKKLPPKHKGRVLDGAVPIVAKMANLLDYYDIPGDLGDPDAVWLLAFMLTRDHHVKWWPPTHPPRKNPPHRPYDLVVGVRDLNICRELGNARNEGRSVRQAARDLAGKWQQKGYCHWKGISLEKRYYDIRRSGGATKGMIQAAKWLNKSRSALKS